MVERLTLCCYVVHAAAAAVGCNAIAAIGQALVAG